MDSGLAASRRPGMTTDSSASSERVVAAVRSRQPHIASMQQHQAPEAHSDNSLLAQWSDGFGVPPFERIEPQHFPPAFARAFAAHEAEVAAVAADAAEPTFANTIDALELSGAALRRVGHVFRVLAGAHTNDAILAIERELAPLQAKHWNRILMDEALFRRIDFLYR